MILFICNNIKKLKNVLLIVICIIVLATGEVIASDNTGDYSENLENHDDLESVIENELLLFEDIPLVYSVSRTAQRIDELSIPVNLITDDDIHFGGFVNISELLSYNLGVDIMPYSRNGYRMSMGGAGFTFFDQTVTLINGRNVNNIITGGTDLLTTPIFMEDIDRIEVVRGPGGAAWGTNAFNGVVNIVTKRPEDSLGFMYSGTVNQYGDSYSHFRWAEKKDNWQWRVSLGYNSWGPTSDTLGNDNLVSNDFASSRRLDSVAIVKLSDLTELSFGAAWDSSSMGGTYQPTLASVFDFTAPAVNNVNSYDYQRYFVKLERKDYDDYSFYLQYYNNSLKYDRNPGFRARTMENDLEGQLDLNLDDHDLLLGLNFRQYQLDSMDNQYSFQFNKDRYNDYQLGLFLVDRWHISDSLELESQIRSDYFSETESADWSGRFSVINKISEMYNQKMHLSVARSFRTPSYGWRNASFLDVRTDPEAVNEKVVSYEAGYGFEPTRNVSVNINTFYRKYSNLLSSLLAFGSLGNMYIMVSNGGEMDTVGIESKVNINFNRSSTELWVSYDQQKMYEPMMSLAMPYPSGLKAGLSYRYRMTDNWTASANYKYSHGVTDSIGTNHVDDYHLGSLAFTRAFAEGRGDLTIGVSNLFNTDFNLWNNNGELWESVGRTFFGRIQINF